MLALHAMACVAGFIAGSSLPIAATGYTGWWRRVHDHAGRLAMAFVAAATLFSLATQAYALGADAADLADAHGVSPRAAAGRPAAARAARAVRAVPTAGRWLPREPPRAWHELLAATFVTTAIAVP